MMTYTRSLLTCLTILSASALGCDSDTEDAAEGTADPAGGAAAAPTAAEETVEVTHEADRELMAFIAQHATRLNSAIAGHGEVEGLRQSEIDQLSATGAPAGKQKLLFFFTRAEGSEAPNVTVTAVVLSGGRFRYAGVGTQMPNSPAKPAADMEALRQSAPPVAAAAAHVREAMTAGECDLPFVSDAEASEANRSRGTRPDAERCAELAGYFEQGLVLSDEAHLFLNYGSCGQPGPCGTLAVELDLDAEGGIEYGNFRARVED